MAMVAVPFVWVSARRGYYPPAVAASFARDFPEAHLVQLESPAERFIGEIQTKRPIGGDVTVNERRKRSQVFLFHLLELPR